MTLDEIQAAVNEGKTVHWISEIYVVRKDKIGQWHILCTVNQHCIGLTHQDGKTMNGEAEDFYIAEPLPREIALTCFADEIDGLAERIADKILFINGINQPGKLIYPALSENNLAGCYNRSELVELIRSELKTPA